MTFYAVFSFERWHKCIVTLVAGGLGRDFKAGGSNPGVTIRCNGCETLTPHKTNDGL